MKIMFIFLISFFAMQGAEQNVAQIASLSFSQEESACYAWVEAAKKAAHFSYTSLSVEDQKVFQTCVKYTDEPEKLQTACTHFAKRLYESAEKVGFERPYNVPFVAETLLKMKRMLESGNIIPIDRTTARMYVFSQLLSPEERKTVLKENYLKNSQATHAAMLKAGWLLAEELVKLKLIENTDSGKESAALEYYAAKMEEIKKDYGQ
jgi:hypothetical protein